MLRAKVSNTIFFLLSLLIAGFGGVVFGLAVVTKDEGLGVFGFAALIFGLYSARNNIKYIREDINEK